MFNCPSCGAPMKEGQRFCASCGAQVPDAQPNYGTPGGYSAPGGYTAPGAYGAPTGYPTRSGAAPVSFQQKNIAVCIILTLVTCGIYGIVWLIDMVNNLNEASGDTSANSGGTVFLLGLVTCGIYLLIWMYKAGDQMNTAKSSRGIMADSNSGIMYLLLSIFGLSLVAYALIQSDLNKIAAMYGAPAA